MFIIINRIGDNLTGSIKGEAFGIKFTPEKYASLLQYQAAANEATDMAELNAILDAAQGEARESYKEVVEHKTPYLYVNQATGKFYLKVGTGDSSRVSSEPLPEAFVNRIIKSVELGIDVLPLVKAWSRFLRNPNYSSAKARLFANYINTVYTDYTLAEKLEKENGVSKEVAVARATGYQTPITQEGLICTYKVSTELTEKFVLDEDGEAKAISRFAKTIDENTGEITETKPEFVEDRVFAPAVMGNGGDAFFCGAVKGHIIRVGERHHLESWAQVDTNDNRSGVKGLHCGNLDYIRGFQNSGTETHNTFVDPMFIGAFTNDGSGAIRVLEYYTHSSFAGPNRGIYHSSKYAAQTDAAYAKSFEEAVAKFEESDAERVARLAEKAALRVI